ncbi:hypothetical protein LEP1GSC040_0621 [Leptospira santarosai str. 2000030832]|nr:hypothetical protein LEP1GSC040_0621 [Leptospira santarosai str. 2000030832]
MVKAAFSAYEYIRPEFSQLYLDEFSFLKNTTTQRVTLYRSQLRT